MGQRRTQASLAIAAMLLAILPSAAVAAPEARSLEPACPDGQVPPSDLFDTDRLATHTAAVECIVWWGLADGASLITYFPTNRVTRAQMATFVARLVTAAGGELPDATDTLFTDLPVTHRDSIERLAAAGIVRGTTPTTFDPGGFVARDQMAAFLVRAYEYVIDGSLPLGDNPFLDLGTTHRDDVIKAATAGFAAGTGPTTYDPSGLVTRGQMASFLARVLAAAVEDLEVALPDRTGPRLAGTGDTVITGGVGRFSPSFVLPMDLFHEGDGRFAVWSLDADGVRVEALVDTTGPYEGQRLASVAGRLPEVVGFEVVTDGAWSLRIRPPSVLRELGSGVLEGTRDEVIAVPDTRRGDDIRATHAGEGAFAVIGRSFLGAEEQRYVEVVGSHDGAFVVEDAGGIEQVLWLQLTSTGPWSLELP